MVTAVPDKNEDASNAEEDSRLSQVSVLVNQNNSHAFLKTAVV